MPEYSFRPWRFAAGALALMPVRLEIDGTEVAFDELYAPASNHLNLVGRTISDNLKLECVITDQGHELPTTVPDSPPEDAIGTFARVSIPATRARVAVPGVRLEGGAWGANVVLTARELRGRIVIEPGAARVTSIQEQEGFANRRHDHLADGTALKIDLDESAVLPGHGFDGEWIDFGAEDSPEALREAKDTGWLLDFSNPNKPKLLLNSGIDGFRQLLELPARSGQRARLRDAVTHSVLQPVLTLLTTEALEVLVSEEEEDLEAWPSEVVLTMAMRAGNTTPELRKEAWVTQWRAGQRAAVLRDIEVGVQRHIGLANGIRDLTKSFQTTLSGA